MGVESGVLCEGLWRTRSVALLTPDGTGSSVVVIDGRGAGAPDPAALRGLDTEIPAIVFGLTDDEVREAGLNWGDTWRYGRLGTLSTGLPGRWPGSPVVVATAGTVDAPVARCVAGLCAAFGACVDVVEDVGVAGLHRLTAAASRLRRSRVIVVCAGMDGALPRVVAELFDAAVVFVPCRVGYGVAEDGLAAFLCGVSGAHAGVSCCAPGDVVGGAFLALRLARLFEGGSAYDSLP